MAVIQQVPNTGPQPSRAGGQVAATVGCAVVGLIVGGPIGAIIGGSVGAIVSKTGGQQVQTSKLAVSSARFPREAIQEHRGVTYFAIDVVPTQGAPWRILRRYSQLRSFMEQIGKRRHPFPGKHWFCCQGVRLEERRRGLEVWLNAVIRDHQQSLPANRVGAWQSFLEAGSVPLLQPAAGAVSSSGNSQVISVQVPAGIVPGQTIKFAAPDGSQRCFQVPAGATAGTVLQVQWSLAARVPELSASTAATPGPPARLESGTSTTPSSASGAPTTSPATDSANEKVLLSITVPQGVTAGQLLAVQVPGGRTLRVEVPQFAGPELELEFDPVAQTLSPVLQEASQSGAGKVNQSDSCSHHDLVMNVPVPAGVTPGQFLSVKLPDGRQLPVEVPSTARPGGSFLVRLEERSGQLVPAA
eukprot:TRINITY_DN24337_c0_g1_i1.p1 TRINITY_DN24337_c0_g1~~TRINITY_DN24337_c0_g1_i1.p1  ORF type:complete len:414 (-),score=62.32 TRINITY_DN24337_c0_g1_i1:147-1388(-)